MGHREVLNSDSLNVCYEVHSTIIPIPCNTISFVIPGFFGRNVDIHCEFVVRHLRAKNGGRANSTCGANFGANKKVKLEYTYI